MQSQIPGTNELKRAPEDAGAGVMAARHVTKYLSANVILFPNSDAHRESRIRFELQVLAVLIVALIVNLLIVLIYSGAI